MCAFVWACDLQGSRYVSQPEPAHLCVHPNLWVKVTQHCLGEVRESCGFCGVSGSLCPAVGVYECACVCMHLDLSLYASGSIS